MNFAIGHQPAITAAFPETAPTDGHICHQQRAR
jgi:hypothetical protein